MQEFLDGLSPKLRYLESKKRGSTLEIFCESEPIEDKKIHSRTERVVKDINFGNYKVELHILWKRYFNFDTSLEKLTFMESFDFIDGRKNRTKRLDEMILAMSDEMSAIGCERYIKDNVADVSDTTILRLVKKNRLKRST